MIIKSSSWGFNEALHIKPPDRPARPLWCHGYECHCYFRAHTHIIPWGEHASHVEDLSWPQPPASVRELSWVMLSNKEAGKLSSFHSSQVSLGDRGGGGGQFSSQSLRIQDEGMASWGMLPLLPSLRGKGNLEGLAPTWTGCNLKFKDSLSSRES